MHYDTMGIWPIQFDLILRTASWQTKYGHVGQFGPFGSLEFRGLAPPASKAASCAAGRNETKFWGPSLDTPKLEVSRAALVILAQAGKLNGVSG